MEESSKDIQLKRMEKNIDIRVGRPVPVPRGWNAEHGNCALGSAPEAVVHTPRVRALARDLPRRVNALAVRTLAGTHTHARFIS
jgi:hypothetical protein